MPQSSPSGLSFWQALAPADYSEKVRLTRQMLAENVMINQTTVMDLIQRLYVEGIAVNARSLFDEVAAAVQEHQPDLYETLASMLLDWRLMNALADGRLADVHSLARVIAATAADHPLTFHDNIDRLAYHGHLGLMVEMIAIAWPELQKVGATVPGSLEGLAARATDAIIYQYLAHNPAIDAHDPTLQAQLETYFAISPERLDQYMAFISGDIVAQWRPEHFELPPNPPAAVVNYQAPAATVQNLQTLALGFVGYLYRQEGVPFSKGDLTRQHIPRYILDRHSGVLNPRQPLADLSQRDRPPHLAQAAQPVAHPLCPDLDTFQRYLDRLLVSGNPQPYRAAATFELMPAWLRYLESANLIDAGQHQQTRQALAPLPSQMAPTWSNYQADPSLHQNVQLYHDSKVKKVIASDDNGKEAGT
jgi:hypothetical protein